MINPVNPSLIPLWQFGKHITNEYRKWENMKRNFFQHSICTTPHIRAGLDFLSLSLSCPWAHSLSKRTMPLISFSVLSACMTIRIRFLSLGTRGKFAVLTQYLAWCKCCANSFAFPGCITIAAMGARKACDRQVLSVGRLKIPFSFACFHSTLVVSVW